MNIFISDPDPILSAIALDDRRRNKMIVESCQMLATSLILSGAPSYILPTTKEGKPYKLSHSKHPATIWVSLSQDNFLWLIAHTTELIKSYTSHTGKHHTCQKALAAAYTYSHYIKADSKLTPFVNCATHHKHIEDVHRAYQLELMKKWNEANPKFAPKWNGCSTFPGFPNPRV